MGTINPVGNGLTGATGTGSFVGSTSPTLVTPTLGVAAATSVNLGDDAFNKYKTGSWTPELFFGGLAAALTYGSQAGQYTQIGNIVYVTGIIGLTNKGTSVGDAKVSGLPIPEGGSPPASTLTCVNPQNITITNNNFLMLPNSGGVGSTSFQITYFASGGANNAYTNTHFSNTSQITFSGFYFSS